MVRETADELHLATGVRIKALPCSARSTRGLPIATVILDELAHFVDTQDGYQAGEAIYRALAPSVAQFGRRGRVIGLSTPRGRRGIFWKLWTGADADLYRLHGPTWEMNPGVPTDFLDRERERDPDLFAQEFAADFLAGGGSFLDPAALRAAVGIPDHEHVTRVLALDPAFVRDAFALALACRDAEGTSHGEWVRVLEPPVGFAAAM